MFYSTHNTKPGGTPLSEVGKYWVSPRLPKKKKAKIAKRAFDQKAFADFYLNRTTPAAPEPAKCFEERRLNTTIATPDAVIRAGQVRRAEIQPAWVPGPEQSVRPTMTSEGIVAAAEKARSPMQAPPMDPMAKAIVDAGRKRSEPAPEPTGLAAKIIRAGKLRRGEEV